MTSDLRDKKKLTTPAPVEAKTVTGLDQARRLMPQIEEAKARLSQKEYGAYLKTLGVTRQQVRQWRRRLKNAGGVTQTVPKKPAASVKTVTSKKDKPSVTGEYKVVEPLGASLNSISIDKGYGEAIIGVEQVSEFIWVGKRDDIGRRYNSYSPMKSETDGTAEWHARITDLGFTADVEVLRPGATDDEIAKELLAKMRDMLTKLNLWRDDLEEIVWDHLKKNKEYAAEQAKNRRERAQKAAATRARKKAAKAAA
jgi:transcription elongation GreA/GreB family factor